MLVIVFLFEDGVVGRPLRVPSRVRQIRQAMRLAYNGLQQ